MTPIQWRASALACGICCGLAGCGADPASAPPVDWPVDKDVFPARFMWGAAGSAHQTEGHDVDSDWWTFENEGRVYSREVSGIATDHYHRFEEDFDHLLTAHLDTYRMSLSWGRLYPRPDMVEPDAVAVAHYDAVFEALSKRHIRPMVTLLHFSSPQWLTAEDRWGSGGAISDFRQYAEFAARRWGRYVDWWITINEPEVYAVQGWNNAIFPPGKRDLGLSLKVVSNLMRAHAEAYRAIHREDAVDSDGDGIAASVGVSKLMVPVAPYDTFNVLEQAGAWFLSNLNNSYWFVLDRTGLLDFGLPRVGQDDGPAAFHGALDFIGVNYYSRQLFSLDASAGLIGRTPPGAELSDLGKETWPQGLYDSMSYLAAFGLPLIVTESGVADADDRLRASYIRRHVAAVSRFMRDRPDVPVLGFIYWSLTDNFEWENGFAPRFGLYAVDYSTLERTMRPSTLEFAALIDEIRHAAEARSAR